MYAQFKKLNGSRVGQQSADNTNQNAPKYKVGKFFGKLVLTNCINDNRPIPTY